jgi:hypothetical protein
LEHKTFVETRILPIFTNISHKILEGMTDPKQTDKFLEIVISEGIKVVFEGEVELTETEKTLVTQQLRSELDSHIESLTEVDETHGENGYTGILATNYQRMISDHRAFLPIK